MDRKDIIASLEIQPVDRLDQISREVENVNTAAIVELSVGKRLRDEEKLVAPAGSEPASLICPWLCYGGAIESLRGG